MKIVNKKEFYLLPNGTLYSKYERYGFQGLMVKQNTLYYENKPIDFLYDDLIGNIDVQNSDEFIDKLYDAEINKTSLSMDFDCTERDGLYEDEQMFAIYEDEDLKCFIKKLNYGKED